MGTRLELQTLLESIPGVLKVYFQPPKDVQLQYPCIIYMREGTRTFKANNGKYFKRARYQVTVIDTDPDSVIPDVVLDLPLCAHDRFYTASNLNHHVFTLFF